VPISKLSLIIGIDVYADKELVSLPSCKKDAIDLNELLLSKGFDNFGNSPIIGSDIIDKEYSGAIIRDIIFKFFKEAKSSQTLLFYFSGHGVHGGNDVYLATPDVEVKNPGARAFSLEDITKCMAESKSTQLIGIVDACYSGGINLPNSKYRKMSPDDSAQQALKKYRETLTKFFKTKHYKETALLLSSQPFQQSNAPQDGSGNSIYTKYLLEGIRGVKSNIEENGLKIPGSIDEEGNVTPRSLHKYISYFVGKDCDQAPEFKSDESNDQLILASYPNFVDGNAEKASSKFSDIEKKANKIADCYGKFKGLFLEWKRLGEEDTQFAADMEETGKTLKLLYLKSEQVKGKWQFYKETYEKGSMDQSRYVEMIPRLIEEMAGLELELENIIPPKIERIEIRLSNKEALRRLHHEPKNALVPASKTEKKVHHANLDETVPPSQEEKARLEIEQKIRKISEKSSWRP